jgi:peptide chain release factor subunit 1
MAGTVTWETLRELASFRAEKGCAISLYLNLDPSVAPTAGDVDSRMNALLAGAEKRLDSARGELTHEQREGLKADLRRIAAYFETEFSREGARGFAVFVAGLDNFWRSLAVVEPVADDLTVAREFHLAPLVPLVGRGDGALVAVVGREQGQLYRLRRGRLEEVVDQFDEAPSRHDQGGWSQARYQRHIENLVQEHLKTFVDQLERRARRLGHPPLVIVASDETRAELAPMLSKEAETSVAGWTQAEAHASPAELLALVEPVLEKWRSERETKTIQRWREEAGRNGRAASGWGPTLEAASDGRVELLLFQEGVDRRAWQCPKCGRASLEDGSCPLDGMKLEPREDGLDVAVHQTLAHGGSVWAVRHHRDLEPVEGIGALLRY